MKLVDISHASPSPSAATDCELDSIPPYSPSHPPTYRSHETDESIVAPAATPQRMSPLRNHRQDFDRRPWFQRDWFQDFCSCAALLIALGSFAGAVLWAVLSSVARVNSANAQREAEQAAWKAKMESMGIDVLDVS